jgi:hypothetical protein
MPFTRGVAVETMTGRKGGSRPLHPRRDLLGGFPVGGSAGIRHGVRGIADGDHGGGREGLGPADDPGDGGRLDPADPAGAQPSFRLRPAQGARPRSPDPARDSPPPRAKPPGDGRPSDRCMPSTTMHRRHLRPRHLEMPGRKPSFTMRSAQSGILHDRQPPGLAVAGRRRQPDGLDQRRPVVPLARDRACRSGSSIRRAMMSMMSIGFPTPSTPFGWLRGATGCVRQGGRIVIRIALSFQGFILRVLACGRKFGRHAAVFGRKRGAPRFHGAPRTGRRPGRGSAVPGLAGYEVLISPALTSAILVMIGPVSSYRTVAARMIVRIWLPVGIGEDARGRQRQADRHAGLRHEGQPEVLSARSWACRRAWPPPSPRRPCRRRG